MAMQAVNTELAAPRHGIATLYGYGICVRVDRGHLVFEDGIGGQRRRARLPRVAHGLRRLVVIGSDGMVSLAALRWLADQDAAFVMLDRDGSVLATTGPVRPSDARLRRAQAVADLSGVALLIAIELISQKLAGQEKVARAKLQDFAAAEIIAHHRLALATAETIDAVRQLESRAATAYWSAWRNLAIAFPRNDLHRVPDHWRIFGTRKSPLSGSPRLAANPPNAMLNYLYALLESESRLALAALGLDPGLGVLHVDTPARDSLACDLMEAARPEVDAYVLDWITGHPLRREWFFEQRDGTCRLMGPFAVRLSETATAWGRAVAPLAEWIARTLWSTTTKSAQWTGPATRLTQRRKREARGIQSHPPALSAPKPTSVCRVCGKPIAPSRTICGACAVTVATENLAEVSEAGRALGRAASRTVEAQTRRANTRRRNALAQDAWRPSSQPAWLTDEVYSRKIQPLLAQVSNSAIASRLSVSRCYAGHIRLGRRPHPRHWQALAKLVNVDQISST